MKTQTKEHGLLFKGDMVQAILDDQKTQTRRILTRFNTRVDGPYRADQNTWDHFDFNDVVIDPGPSPAGNPGPYLKVKNTFEWETRRRIYPKFFVGDKIWVREAWRNTIDQPGIMFRADGWEDSIADYGYKWKSPIHMFKKDARIWLEINEVRIQRIQEISNDDIVAEGIPFYVDAKKRPPPAFSGWVDLAKGLHTQKFINLWDKINEARGFPWENNDWVIALTFKRIEKPHK